MVKVQAIVPAAGRGVRLKRRTSKALIPLNGKPLVYYSLAALERCSLIHSIILVVQPAQHDRAERMIKALRLRKVTRIIDGGKERSDSVFAGLQCLDKDTRFVLVHDAARPMLNERLIKEAIRQARRFAAAVAAVKLKAAVKEINPGTGMVERTLDREKIYEIQTPQAFDRDLLLRAHLKRTHPNPTDDAALVEALGVKVKIFPGDHFNLKVTTPEDLVLAGALLRIPLSRRWREWTNT